MITVADRQAFAQILQAIHVQSALVHAFDTTLLPLVVLVIAASLFIWVTRIATDDGYNEMFKCAAWFATAAMVLALNSHMAPLQVGITDWTAQTGMANADMTVAYTTTTAPLIDRWFGAVSDIDGVIAAVLMRAGAFPLTAQHCTNQAAIYANAFDASLKQIRERAAGKAFYDWGIFAQCLQQRHVESKTENKSNWLKQQEENTPGFVSQFQQPETSGSGIEDPACDGYIAAFKKNLTNLSIICPEAKTPGQQRRVLGMATDLQKSPFIGPVPDKFYQQITALNPFGVSTISQAVAGKAGYGQNAAVSLMRLTWEKVTALKMNLGAETTTATYFMLVIQGMLLAVCIIATPFLMIFIILPIGGKIINLRIFIGWLVVYALISLWVPAILFCENLVYNHYL